VIDYNLDQFSEIVYHLKNISTIYKDQNDWVQIFCQYCNDSTRSVNPNHGHMYVAKEFPFCLCFRCDTHISLIKLLVDTGFTNESIIRKLKAYKNNYTYYNYDENKFSKNNKLQFSNIYNSFKKDHPEAFEFFSNYINCRIMNVNPIKFGIYPSINQHNQLLCNFVNYDNNLVTSRVLSNSNVRYLNSKNKDYYYFQDIDNIDEYSSVVVCEGVFDCINLYKYSHFKNSFFIAINGRFYQRSVEDIIKRFLLINKIHFNIIFDIDISDKLKIKKKILKNVNEINPKITFSFYQPIYTKDVSELMLYEGI
jgi:hypothetical protein